jgi:hypothetical protein
MMPTIKLAQLTAKETFNASNQVKSNKSLRPIVSQLKTSNSPTTSIINLETPRPVKKKRKIFKHGLVMQLSATTAKIVIQIGRSLTKKIEIGSSINCVKMRGKRMSCQNIGTFILLYETCLKMSSFMCIPFRHRLLMNRCLPDQGKLIQPMKMILTLELME